MGPADVMNEPTDGFVSLMAVLGAISAACFNHEVRTLQPLLTTLL